MVRDNNYNFTEKVALSVGIFLLFVSVIALVIYAFNFFLLVFGAILFAVLLRAAANFLSDKFNISKGISITTVILTIIALTALLVIMMVPMISSQVEQIQETLPTSIQQLENELRRYEWGQVLLERVQENIESILPDAQEALQSAYGLLGTFVDILIVMVLGIFFAIDPQLYKNGIISLVPPRFRERTEEVIYISYKTLALWLFGKFLSMAAVGILTWIGLMIIGMPFTFGLSVIAFVFDFIPNVGPILAAIPAVLIAFLVSPQTALIVGILYLVIQSIESYILVPIIFKKTVSISPVITLASMIFFGIFAGALGVILATPLIAVIKVFVVELYVRDYLEADVPEHRKTKSILDRSGESEEK